MNNDNIYQALGVFLEAMRPFVVSVIQKHFPDEPWEGVFFARLTPDKQRTWNQAQVQGVEPVMRIDYNNLTYIATKFRDEMTEELGGNKANAYKFENCLRELQDARNKCQHYQSLDDDEKERAYSNMKVIANMLGMPDLREEIEHFVKKQEAAPVITPKREKAMPTTSVVTKTISIDDASLVIPWYRNCLPHYDIRSGTLDESIFAANLNEVALGTGPEVYTNPTTFFTKTYITAGLKDIANRVVRALNGEETENRVISLQTGFGGGKTHTLISIYHIVKGGARLLSSPVCANLLQNGVKATFDNARVAVFTNNTTDVVQGRTTPEGITIHTLWGEIAYQLGGAGGYEQMRRNDEEMIAPTSSILKPIIEQAGVSLILIDELADYCIKAAAKKVGGGSLYNQTNSFIQTLTEVVSAVPRCVLIATLPASKTEVGDSQTGQEILDTLQERIVRVGANVKPVDDEEVYEVVRRRLFEHIDNEQVVDAVAKRYKDMFHNRRTDLPDYCDRLEYQNKIKKSYPFHPELIEMFRQRWGSDSRFQRTRGVLRLLASIVQDLWKRRDSLTGLQALIHTSDVYLENLNSLTGTITNLMGSQWETVMLADVYGTSSNSRKIDELDPQGNNARYHLTQGIATTLLMASVGAKQNKGLNLKQLKLCVLRPKAFNHNDVDGALNKLEQVAHYLHVAKVGVTTYWFESKANINILLSQAKGEIKQEEIDSEIIRMLQEKTKNISEIKILVSPSTEVPEQKQLTLAIMHPKYAIPTGGNPSISLQKAIETIALTHGNTDRVLRNTIFYLICSEAGRGALNSKLLDVLACKKILQEYTGRLEKDQVYEIRNRQDEYTRQSNEALIRAYNVVAKYRAKSGMETYELKEYASDFTSQIRINLIREVMDEEWIVKSIGRGVLDRINMLPTKEHPVQVTQLYETFLRFDDKPMILSSQAIVDTVNKYCSQGVFNVAVGSNGNYTKVYHEESVPFLDVTDEDYWLVDTSVKIETNGSGNDGGNGSSGSGSSSGEEGGSSSNGSGNGNSSSGNGGGGSFEPKTYRQLTISGSVPLENYSQLFSSFINTLKNNNLKIEIKFTAKSNPTNPLTENSATVKSVKESASQLGLNFETEE